MVWVFAGAAVVVLLVVAWLATGRGGGLAPLPDDVADFALPDRPLDGDDVEAVRLGTGLQGYRVDQVDALLDRVAQELRRRDVRIAELEAGGGAPLPQRPPPPAGGAREP